MRRRPVVACLLLAVLVAAAYAPVIGFDFIVFDDPNYVVLNPLVNGGLSPGAVARAFTGPHGGFWIPATWLSLMADWSLWGGWAGGFHLTNALLHAANVALVLLLLFRLTGEWRASLLAALLFALHPVNVQAVAWVTARKDVLSLFLGLLAAIAWVRYLLRPSPARYLASLALFALSLMAKPMLVTLPALLLVLDWWPLGRLGVPGIGRPAIVRVLLEKVPLLALSAAVTLAAVLTNAAIESVIPLQRVSPWDRLANALHFYVGYLGKGIWPARLGIYFRDGNFHTPAGLVAMAALVLAVVTLAVLLVRRRLPFLASGWSWYLVTLLPVSGLVPVGEEATADRWVYLPFIGLYLAAASGVIALADRWRLRRGAPLLAAAIVALLLPPTLAQVATWRDSETLFGRAVSLAPDSLGARETLALSHYVAGRMAEAEAESRLILSRHPSSYFALHVLGDISLERGETAVGIDFLRRAAEETTRTPFKYDIGRTLLDAGDPVGAAAVLKEVVRVEPGNAGALAYLGTALAETGMAAEAEQALRRAAWLDPAAAMPRFNLGVLLARQGRREAAAEAFREVLRLDPSNERARAFLRQVEQPPGN